MLFLCVYFKKVKNNFFITVFNNFGKIIWTRSLGCFKFKNIEKRANEAFNFSLNSLIDFILNNNIKNIFLKLAGIRFNILKKIYMMFLHKFRKYKLYILGFSFVHLISHNGCKIND